MGGTHHGGTAGGPGVIAVGAVVALLLVGCSSEDVAERIVEDRIESETGDDVDIDIDDGEVRIQTDDGEVSIDSDDGVTVIESEDGTATISEGGADLPDGFPDSVPLPDGFTPQYTQEISNAEGEAWLLGGEIDGDANEYADAYIAQLEAAGFEQLQKTESPGLVIAIHDDGEYSVNLSAGADSDGVTFLTLAIGPSGS